MKGKLEFEKIVKRRTELDMKQSELAEAANVSINIVRSVEIGRSESSVEALSKICEVLGLNLSDIYNPDFKNTKIVSFVNNKGGVGKTSLCAAIGCILAEQGHKVLFIDFDMQMNLTRSLGVEKQDKHLGMAIDKEHDLTSYIYQTKYENVDIIVSDPSMAVIDMQLFTKINRESIVKFGLKNILDRGIYDFIICDTNPVLGILNYNVLNVTNYVVIPIELEIFSIYGLDTLINYIDNVKKNNEKLKIAGIVVNKYDLREKTITESCESVVTSLFGDKVFKTRIGVDTKLKQSQFDSEPVIYAQKNSRISRQYRELTKELISVVNEK